MKIYNRQLEEIEDKELQQRVTDILENMKNFLRQKYGIDDEIIQKRIEDLRIVTYSKSRDKTVFKDVDGEIQEVPVSLEVGAYQSEIRVTFNGDECHLNNAIFIDKDDPLEILSHRIAHEIFHLMSSNDAIDYKDNIGEHKTGVLLSKYDRKIKLVSEEMRGLNEGITEMLTVEFDGNNTDIYHIPVIMATILNNRENPILLKTYFSNDKEDIQNFLNDFDNRQTTTTSDKLKSIKSTSVYFPIDVDLLRGCLEYSLSYCENMEQLIAERKRLLPIFKDMERDINFKYSDENFDIREMVNSVFNDRRTKLTTKKNTQALGEETLASQNNTAYIDDTAETLEDAERGLEEVKDDTQRS